MAVSVRARSRFSGIEGLARSRFSGIEGFDTTDEPAAQPAAASTRRVSAILSAGSPPTSSCMLQPAGCSQVPSLFDQEKTRLDPMIRKCKITGISERLNARTFENTAKCTSTGNSFLGLFSGCIEAYFLQIFTGISARPRNFPKFPEISDKNFTFSQIKTVCLLLLGER